VLIFLLKLKNHHLAKIENQGRKIYFEQIICEIISHIDCFPSHLTIHEQGAFAIGYYHQPQDFFTKKEDK
jgi:CRISPR-associated protein Csd1